MLIYPLLIWLASVAQPSTARCFLKDWQDLCLPDPATRKHTSVPSKLCSQIMPRTNFYMLCNKTYKIITYILKFSDVTLSCSRAGEKLVALHEFILLISFEHLLYDEFKVYFVI